MDNNDASSRARSAQTQLAEHLKELGKYSAEELVGIIGECRFDHKHKARCDRHLYLIKHLISWLHFGPVWVHIDDPRCFRFAVPGPHYVMVWSEMEWPEGLREYCGG